MITTAKQLRDIIGEVTPVFYKIEGKTASVKPSPEKWSIKETIGHLIDSANNNHQRFVRLQYNETLEFPKYEQDLWVSSQRYNNADWHQIIGLWESYNLHLAFIMENIPPDKLNRTVIIGNSGPFTLEFIMQDYVEHLKHHLKVLLPEIGIDSKFENIYE